MRYTNPPDNVMTQLQVYIEERQEDQDELYERRKGRPQASVQSDASTLPPWLSEIAARAPARYPTVLGIGERCARLNSSETDECVTAAHPIRAELTCEAGTSRTSFLPLSSPLLAVLATSGISKKAGRIACLVSSHRSSLWSASI